MGSSSAQTPILQVNKLKKYFRQDSSMFGRSERWLKAVDGVTFTIQTGETLGLVGESGCGKTTVGRTVIGLYQPTAGWVAYKGINLARVTASRRLKNRRQMQMIFQDPYASLNPRMTVGDIIGEPIAIHQPRIRNKERADRINELLNMVGLNPEHANRYPHEFSGGQRQRIGIARALAVEPELIVCDEPVSAVDVSIQAQIINMLEELQEKLNLTYLIIAHDLSMVKHISDRVAVMYLGKIVEMVESEELYNNPLHPYTRALLSAVPIADPDVERQRKRILLEGDLPSPVNPPSGCYFHTRCYRVLPVCREQEPAMRELGNGHYVACHNV
ncbi:MAG: dipeptide ABC transporter ATP-binding protein [Dethiobacteria bacterium]